MPNYNNITIMLLNEDIQMKMDSARSLMIEDVTKAVFLNAGVITPVHAYYFTYVHKPVCISRIIGDEYGIHVDIGNDYISLSQMNYEEVNCVYNVLVSEGYFQNE